MIKLNIEVMQQEGKKLIVKYTGSYLGDEGEVNIDRSVRLELPSLASWSVVSEAIKLAVRSDFNRHHFVGRRLSIDVSDSPEESSKEAKK